MAMMMMMMWLLHFSVYFIRYYSQVIKFNFFFHLQHLKNEALKKNISFNITTMKDETFTLEDFEGEFIEESFIEDGEKDTQKGGGEKNNLLNTR